MTVLKQGDESEFEGNKGSKKKKKTNESALSSGYFGISDPDRVNFQYIWWCWFPWFWLMLVTFLTLFSGLFYVDCALLHACWVSSAFDCAVCFWLTITGAGRAVWEEERILQDSVARNCKRQLGDDLLFVMTNYERLVFHGVLMRDFTELSLYGITSILCQLLKDITFLCRWRKIRM